MSARITFETNWLPPYRGSEEIAKTSAELRITVGDHVATRFEDEWSKSVQERARVAAYPLALWLASSWWRIRWEPEPTKRRLVSDQTLGDANWRMSHELPAAGGGYIWPNLVLASDGETIAVRCRQSRPLTGEPVRYLSEFAAVVPAREFELAVDDFVDLVCSRLDPVKTQLHAIWNDVRGERANPAEAESRKIEARLGYDPDEALPSLIESFVNLAAKTGVDSASEIAAICAGPDPAQALQRIVDRASEGGIEGKIAVPALPPEPSSAFPWQRGKALAQSARKALGLDGQPLHDKSLCELLEIPASALNPESGTRSDVGLAVRTNDERSFNFLFHKRNRLARRFEAARFVCDYVSSHAGDRWIPVTDATTARQKMQRAFAAEFLCPIDALSDFLGGELNLENFEEASEHFGVSEMAITSHLANNHLIPRSILDETGV